MPFALTADNAIHYLVDRGLISLEAAKTANAETLGGGVSNIVIEVGLAGDADGGLVLKQSLLKLRVEDDWFADRERIHRERAGIDYLAKTHADSGASGTMWTVPRVVDEDRGNFVFVMTAAPQDGVNWKDQLLGGHIDVAVAKRVGSMLGEIHGSSIVMGTEAPDGLKEFEDLDCFVQLRIDPYHGATALGACRPGECARGRSAKNVADGPRQAGIGARGFQSQEHHCEWAGGRGSGIPAGL